LLTLDNSGSGAGARINQLSTSRGDTLSTNITLADDVTFSNAAGDSRTLLVTGNISGEHALVIDSTGAGVTRFEGTNEFSSVTIKSGTLGATKSQALGTGTITIGDASATGANATLTLYGGNSTFSGAGSTTNAIHVVGTGTNTLLHTSWAAEFTGAVTLDQDLILRITGTSTNSLAMSGAITGAGGLIIDVPWGTGEFNAVTITGSGNTYAGGLILKAGRARVQQTDGFGTGEVTIGDTANTAATNVMLTVGGASHVAPTNAIHVRGDGANTIRVNGWSATLHGQITLHDSDLTLLANNASGAVITIAGNITGDGDLTLETVSHATSTTATGSRVYLNGEVNHTGAITTSGTGQANYSGRGAYIAGTIGANVTDITQTGAESRLTLTGANNAFTGDVKIEGGSLTLGSGTSTTLATFLTDTTSLYLYTNDNSALILNFKDATVIESLAGLYIDNVKQADGLWGAPGSIAAGTADHETALITGAGLLQVGAAVPEPATIALLAGALVLGGAIASRRIRARKQT
jgi:autotransporter-associated beta strand protein